jgi:hypothetical protein
MRVIALTSFTDPDTGEVHGYGHEFDQEEGAKLDSWIADGTVRIDDRTAAPPPKASGKKK